MFAVFFVCITDIYFEFVTSLDATRNIRTTVVTRSQSNEMKSKQNIRNIIAELNISIQSPIEKLLSDLYKEASDAFDEDLKIYNEEHGTHL